MYRFVPRRRATIPTSVLFWISRYGPMFFTVTCCALAVDIATSAKRTAVNVLIVSVSPFSYRCPIGRAPRGARLRYAPLGYSFPSAALPARRRHAFLLWTYARIVRAYVGKRNRRIGRVVLLFRRLTKESNGFLLTLCLRAHIVRMAEVETENEYESECDGNLHPQPSRTARCAARRQNSNRNSNRDHGAHDFQSAPSAEKTKRKAP